MHLCNYKVCLTNQGTTSQKNKCMLAFDCDCMSVWLFYHYVMHFTPTRCVCVWVCVCVYVSVPLLLHDTWYASSSLSAHILSYFCQSIWTLSIQLDTDTRTFLQSCFGFLHPCLCCYCLRWVQREFPVFFNCCVFLLILCSFYGTLG